MDAKKKGGGGVVKKGGKWSKIFETLSKILNKQLCMEKN